MKRKRCNDDGDGDGGDWDGGDGDEEGRFCYGCQAQFDEVLPDLFTCGMRVMCADCFVVSTEAVGWTACPNCREPPRPWTHNPQVQQRLEHGRVCRIRKLRLKLGLTTLPLDRDVIAGDLNTLIGLTCYRSAVNGGWACLACTAYNTGGISLCGWCGTARKLSEAWFCEMCTSWNYDNGHGNCIYCRGVRGRTLTVDDGPEVEVLPNFAVPPPSRPSIIDVTGHLVDAFPGAPGNNSYVNENRENHCTRLTLDHRTHTQEATVSFLPWDVGLGSPRRGALPCADHL